MRIITILLASCFCLSTSAQLVLNGSFEQNYYNDYGQCVISVNEFEFDNKISECFLTYSSDTYSVVSVIANDCQVESYGSFGANAQDGNWCIAPFGVFFPAEYVESFKQKTGFTLKLSDSLKIGRDYELSYYIRAWPEFDTTSQIYDNFTNEDYITGEDIPVESCAIEVGFTHNSQEYGTSYHTSIIPVLGDSSWHLQSFVFSATQEFNYLCVRTVIPSSNNLRRYDVLVDNFELSLLSSITDKNLGKSSIYPNPTRGDMFVESAKGHKAIVLDVLARVLHTQEIYPNNKNLININHIEQGNYILHIKDKEGNQIEAKSFVKIR
jgi:hypothetical protein